MLARLQVPITEDDSLRKLPIDLTPWEHPHAARDVAYVAGGEFLSGLYGSVARVSDALLGSTKASFHHEARKKNGPVCPAQSGER
jgi:hypothetical protein